MVLTKEQKEILATDNNIVINAVAGSGKTTTLIEYARTKPETAKILYIVFNRSVKNEAISKFYEKGLFNVTVETAHSLAYKNVVPKNKYSVKSTSYKTTDIVKILNIESENGEKHSNYVLANHINKFMLYFCNSDKEKVSELNYLDVVQEGKAKTFVRNYYDLIELGTRKMLGLMDSNKIPISHDFYLKKFQLSNPTLDYDYILFDEAQDASPAMLNVFVNQNAIKVMVGDEHQQIYGWRYAINSLTKTNYEKYTLTKSFRFTSDIAEKANEVLSWKRHLGYDHNDITKVIGKGKGNKLHKPTAIIGRSNVNLLISAIKCLNRYPEIDRIYFEGNISTYTYADEGASLYDVLNLYNNKPDKVRDELISTMKTMSELEEYVKKTEDAQLLTMIDIVKLYGNNIYSLINDLKEKHVSDQERHTAQIIFSTVHRCKGMEYDCVELTNDFITEEKILKFLEDDKNTTPVHRINEEINLLYVAVTRTKGKVIMRPLNEVKENTYKPPYRKVKVKVKNWY